MNGRTVGSELTAIGNARSRKISAPALAQRGGGGVGQYTRNMVIPIRETRESRGLIARGLHRDVVYLG